MGNVVIVRTARDFNQLPKTMKLNHKTVRQLAKDVGYTDGMISKIKHGAAPMQFENVQAILEAMPKDNQFLAIEVANKFVGITTPVIDGDGIIKEPLSMAIKAMPELTEALSSIQNSLDEMTIPEDRLKPENFEEPGKLVNECFDAVLYLTNLIAYVCKTFGFSMQDMLKKRVKKWIMEGIVKP